MGRRTFAGVATALVLAAPAAAQRPAADADRILRDIVVLADDSWEGRETCTPGIDSAAAYIARRFAALGLQPATPRTNGAAESAADAYFHRYTARPQLRAHQGLGGCDAQNVAAMLRGSDPDLAKEYIIIGAHYDHLGRSTFGSRGGITAADSIHNGADDNASGTAAVLELARLFRNAPLRRSIVFVAFSGEEWGLLGSQQFTSEAMPTGRVQAMVNFDMVGRLRDGRLLVYGTGTATEMAAIVDAANADIGLQISKIPDGVGPSDHTSFYTKGIPVLHLFTDVHREYHTPADHADLVNAPGTARVVDYAARVIEALSDAPPLTLVPAARAAPTASTGTRPYLGTVPDMAAGDVPGQRISDVTPGSPADSAGLRSGDIVVEFGGTPVTDLQSYSDALARYRPGDTVAVVVQRGSERLTLRVTLAARGG